MLVKMRDGRRPACPGVEQHRSLGHDVYTVPDLYAGPMIDAGYADPFAPGPQGGAIETATADPRSVPGIERRGGAASIRHTNTPRGNTPSTHTPPQGPGEPAALAALPGLTAHDLAALDRAGISTLADLRTVMATDGAAGRWNHGIDGIGDAEAERIEAAVREAGAHTAPAAEAGAQPAPGGKPDRKPRGK